MRFDALERMCIDNSISSANNESLDERLNTVFKYITYKQYHYIDKYTDDVNLNTSNNVISGN